MTSVDRGVTIDIKNKSTTIDMVVLTTDVDNYMLPGPDAIAKFGNLYHILQNNLDTSMNLQKTFIHFVKFSRILL